LKFGTIERIGEDWRVTCEPHVRARLRRCFARIHQGASDHVLISDTPENCRDLVWFLERYPMDVPPDQLRTMEQAALFHADQEQRLAQLLSGGVPPVPVDLALPARDYQLFAAQMLDLKRGLLLADDLGVGKTVSAIVPMARAENIPAVVVAPPHLLRQWEEQIVRFLPRRRVYRIRSGKVGKLGRGPPPDVILVSYHMLRSWSETLALTARYVVFEECQQLRNDDSLIFQACRHLARKVPLRIGLSATPIYNYGSEFFPVVDTLLPGCLGTREEFVREWCTPAPGRKSRISDSADFGAYLRREGIMLRRTRRDVRREIPDLARIVHAIDCDLAVLEKLEGAAIALAQVILARNETHRGQRMQASGEFDMVMRQATGIAKAPYVAEFVRMLVENGERKVVVFAWHREVYGILMERLKDLHPVMYTGSESPAAKAQAIEVFTKGTQRGCFTQESSVLLMSLRSGAGVDGLQGVCRTAVFAELDWSPGVHEQCMGRIHRDGQPDPCMAYFLLSEAGSDPIVADVVGLKREQIEGVRNPDSALAEVIDTGEHHLRALARSLLERRGIAVAADDNVLQLAPPEGP
jgi:SNF2 family DNA or RNA helicase